MRTLSTCDYPEPASSLPQGKEDQEFKKKPEIAIDLIERSLKRGYVRKIVLISACAGNNKNLQKGVEERKLKYSGGLPKNPNIINKKEADI